MSGNYGYGRRQANVYKSLGGRGGLSKSVVQSTTRRRGVGTVVNENPVIGVTQSGHPRGITRRVTLKEQLHNIQLGRIRRLQHLARKFDASPPLVRIPTDPLPPISPQLGLSAPERNSVTVLSGDSTGSNADFETVPFGHDDLYDPTSTHSDDEVPSDDEGKTVRTEYGEYLYGVNGVSFTANAPQWKA